MRVVFILIQLIHYFIPYSTEGDLGKAYNYYANLVANDEDWICFLDADTCIGLIPKFGHLLEEIVSLYPDTGMFTCYASRIKGRQQRYNDVISEDVNVLNHKKTAVKQAELYSKKVKKLSRIISGHLMLVKKSVWKNIGGAPEGIGILTVDNRISRNILKKGYNILLMEGIYLFHFYRLDTGIKDKSHLKK